MNSELSLCESRVRYSRDPLRHENDIVNTAQENMLGGLEVSAPCAHENDIVNKAQENSNTAQKTALSYFSRWLLVL